MNKRIVAKSGLSLAGAATLGLAVAEQANAALTWTGVTLNTADVESYMMLAVPGLAVLWGLRKVVKMMNRT